MPSPKSKSNKSRKSKTNPQKVQTVASMFAKQNTLNWLKQGDNDDDDDDFVQITKFESKSKYFKRKSSEMQSATPEKNDGASTDEGDKPNGIKKRKLSLRKLSAKVERSPKSDDSVIVLSDSPVKIPTERLSNCSHLKPESSNNKLYFDEKNAESSSSSSKKTRLSKSKSKNRIKETSVGIGHRTDSDSNIQNGKKDEISDARNLTTSDSICNDSNHYKDRLCNGDQIESSESFSSSNSDVTKTEQEFQIKGQKSTNGLIDNNKDENSNSSNELPQISCDEMIEKTMNSKNERTSSKDKNSLKNIEEKNSTKTKTDKPNRIQKVAKSNSSPTRTNRGQSSSTKKSSKNGVNDSQNLAEEENEEENGKEGYKVPYYLENFTTILNSVMEDESNVNLFNKADVKVIDQFRILSENGKKLYVRLFSRKLQWLNCDKIKYPEISADLTEVIQELIDADFLHSESDLNDLEETLKILPAPKLKQLAKNYSVNSGQPKPQIVADLIKKTKQTTIEAMFGAKGGLTKDMLSKAKKHAGQCIKLKDEERKVFVRVLMLFSVVTSVLDEDNANGGQSQLFQMLMVNMGKVIYPEYTINKQTQIFPDRQHVLLYEKALQYEADMINFTEKSKWEDAYQLYLVVKQEFSKIPKKQKTFESKLPDFLRRYTVGYQLVRILSQGIEILQRRKDYHGAIELIESLLQQQIYCLDYHGYWWERRVLNLGTHLKKPQEALELVKKGMADENVRGGHRLALYQRAEKICQTTSLKIKHRLTEFTHEEVIVAPKTTVEGRIIPYSLPGVRHQFMTQDSYFNGKGLDEQVTMCNVEQVVLDYYKQDYPEGLHAEGAIISTLFSLFFWDILFMDVPDAFHSFYQTNPLDKMSLEFYKRRKTEIDDRLEWLENSTTEELNERSRETWEKNCDKTCAGINWERLQSIEYIQGLIDCIGGKLLSGILSRYAKDPRHTRSGFPDLTIWNTENKTFKIVEVKGPGDRLSHKQILWLSYLLKIGVDAEVCHVKAVGAKKLKAGT
ncbi:hypothetical protein LOTGIDRAFT_157864 [Lottia gigantea]|uniref:Fanconi-associated nuclease n=1 Tax=Lottia gigantea TaxID=225164 RepID=V4CF11_LOTGI|nr:hypothetical protein LOTGIDRAFT_157864 [Lottia gigantea]ESP00585.1 hypothetical protein LOTGIDRAFT_157864 [Lottia gigantea]